MKLEALILLVIGSFGASLSHPYRRFTYIAHNYSLPTRDTNPLLQEMVKHNVFDIKRPATYTLKHSELRSDFVYLTRLDKWRIVRVLRVYTPETILTPLMINHIVAPLGRKRKAVIRNVLQDLTKQQAMTIGTVLYTLGCRHADDMPAKI